MAFVEKKRKLYFMLFNLAFLIAYHPLLIKLFRLSFNDRLYSHMILLPFVSGYLIYSRRNNVFSKIKYSFSAGFVLMGLAILFYFIGNSFGENLGNNDYLSLMMSSAIVFWLGFFILIYGTQAFRKAAFPLLILVFMIPIPTGVLQNIIAILSKGSAEAAHWLFALSGVPVLREGFAFHLPGLSIEVTEACSGIRSAVALFVTSILAGYFFLRIWWSRVLLTLAIFPIAIFKNGLRIVTLSLLGLYVDERILTSSPLHTQGGIPFFIVALLLMLPVLWGLRKLEGIQGTGDRVQGNSGQ